MVTLITKNFQCLHRNNLAEKNQPKNAEKLAIEIFLLAQVHLFFSVRNLLIMSSVFSLFGGCILFIVSSLLLVIIFYSLFDNAKLFICLFSFC